MLELHWTTDGERIASASPDKSVRVWDAATGAQVHTAPMAWSHDVGGKEEKPNWGLQGSSYWEWREVYVTRCSR